MRIGNLLAAIKIGYEKKYSNIIIQKSRGVKLILLFLFNFGYINGFTIFTNNKINIFLKYNRAILRSILNISKGSKRIYVKIKKLKKIKKYSIDNSGVLILTTNKGILTREMALNLHVGGEALFYIS